MRVEQYLRHSVVTNPEKAALVAGNTRLSYQEIDTLSDSLAASLTSNGVGRGDRVVLFLDNCWQTVVGIFGTLKAGAVFCPVNPSTKADKLAFILNDCQATAMLSLGRLHNVASEAAAKCPSVKLNLLIEPRKGATIPGALDFDTEISDRSTKEAPAPLPLFDHTISKGLSIDLAMLIYTSGSTGTPKGVMMTHQNIDAAATAITTYLQNTRDDIILNVLPVSFDYGLYQILMSVRMGATLVLEKSFAFPYAIMEKLAAEKVTGFPLVPTMAAMLLQMKDIQPDAFPTLRYITNTAAALPVSHIRALKDMFPETSLYSMYGLTECKRCTWLPPEKLSQKPGSVGIAIPGTEAYIVDDSGARVEAGETGELVIRGAHVMQGYWNNQAATDKALHPGPYPWERVLHTGDLFRADGEGFLYFIGRKDDVIKSRGEKVAPKEVEAVLYEMPGVREASVIGVPDPVLGAAIKAIIATGEGIELSERDVIRHCAARLEDFMVPKSVEFYSDLPKSANGKIDRRRLETEYLETA